jgi:hypothetical protein
MWRYGFDISTIVYVLAKKGKVNEAEVNCKDGLCEIESRSICLRGCSDSLGKEAGA